MPAPQMLMVEAVSHVLDPRTCSLLLQKSYARRLCVSGACLCKVLGLMASPTSRQGPIFECRRLLTSAMHWHMAQSYPIADLLCHIELSRQQLTCRLHESLRDKQRCFQLQASALAPRCRAHQEVEHKLFERPKTAVPVVWVVGKRGLCVALPPVCSIMKSKAASEYC